MGEPINEEALQAMISEANEDSESGGVSFEQFRSILAGDPKK